MSSDSELVSASVSTEDVSTAIQQVTEAWKKFPFLVVFTTKERKSLSHPGDEAIPVMGQLADVVKQHPEAMAPHCLKRADEIKKDLDLAEGLEQVLSVVEGLTQALADTVAAARSDAYRNTLRNLKFLRAAARDISGLEAQIEPMEELLSKRAKGKKATPPGVTPA